MRKKTGRCVRVGSGFYLQSRSVQKRVHLRLREALSGHLSNKYSVGRVGTSNLHCSTTFVVVMKTSPCRCDWAEDAQVAGRTLIRGVPVRVFLEEISI